MLNTIKILLILTIFSIGFPTKATLIQPNNTNTTNQTVIQLPDFQKLINSFSEPFTNFLNENQAINQNITRQAKELVPTTQKIYLDINGFWPVFQNYFGNFINNPLFNGLYTILKEILALIGGIIIWALNQIVNILKLLLSWIK